MKVMSKSARPLIELALWRNGIKTTSERIDKIVDSYQSIDPMNRDVFNKFMEMWSNALKKESYE